MFKFGMLFSTVSVTSPGFSFYATFVLGSLAWVHILMTLLNGKNHSRCQPGSPLEGRVIIKWSSLSGFILVVSFLGVPTHMYSARGTFSYGLSVCIPKTFERSLFKRSLFKLRLFKWSISWIRLLQMESFHIELFHIESTLGHLKLRSRVLFVLQCWANFLILFPAGNFDKLQPKWVSRIKWRVKAGESAFAAAFVWGSALSSFSFAASCWV